MTAKTAVEKEPVPTVVFIGRLSANKRPEHAIRAFGLVRRQMPDAQMWVIGSGPKEARLRRKAGPGVIFLGHVSEEKSGNAWHARTPWSPRPSARAGGLL